MAGVLTQITSERQFSDLWERALDLRPDVVDGEGHRYDVIFPGVRNQGAGPDFTGAVLSRDGKTFGGDVELHLEQSGWKSHGHHLDPAYNGVVLQVVLSLARNPNPNASPPTAAVTFPADSPIVPNSPNISSADLEDLGVERFIAKSGGFRLELDAGVPPDQLMYQGLMEAMGYARNRKPFLALSRAAPLTQFEPLRNEPPATAEFGIFAVLAAVGNMFKRVPVLERSQVRRVASSMGARRRLSESDWSMFRVRPHNDPVYRMRAMAHILVHCKGMDFSEYMRAVFERGGANALVKMLSDSPHVGRGFALVIASNVLLPCLYALRPSEVIVGEFRKMPSLPADSVTRGTAIVLGTRISPANAAQHSGLHALAKSLSWPGHGHSRS